MFDCAATKPVGLFFVCHDDHLRKSNGRPLTFTLAPDCVIVTDRRDSKNLDVVLKGMNVVHVENVGEGGVIRCA